MVVYLVQENTLDFGEPVCFCVFVLENKTLFANKTSSGCILLVCNYKLACLITVHIVNIINDGVLNSNELNTVWAKCR